MARAHGRQERRDASGLEEVLVARVEAGHDARQVLLLDGQAANALALGVREEELRQLLLRIRHIDLALDVEGVHIGGEFQQRVQLDERSGAGDVAAASSGGPTSV